MSEENVEVVREAVDAVNRGDPDAFIACLHPDVDWEDTEGFPGLRTVYSGRAEVRAWFEEAFLGIWEDFHFAIEEITEASDGRVLLGVLATARGKGSGVETQARGWNVCWFADGKIARRRLFWARDEALEAAGLSE
jgi:ketosteroid isomerase-like protein